MSNAITTGSDHRHFFRHRCGDDAVEPLVQSLNGTADDRRDFFVARGGGPPPLLLLLFVDGDGLTKFKNSRMKIRADVRISAHR